MLCLSKNRRMGLVRARSQQNYVDAFEMDLGRVSDDVTGALWLSARRTLSAEAKDGAGCLASGWDTAECCGWHHPRSGRSVGWLIA
jgi:hypothetical protein